MKFKTLLLVFASLIIAVAKPVAAQELTPGADLVSRYVWRGLDFGSSPAIQPGLTFSYGDFSIGAWGSLTINDNKFQEQDIFVSYTIADMFSVTVTDYFFPNDDVAMNNYFEYDEDITGHILEATVKFEGTENLPVWAAFNVNFWGADPDNSMYVELGYKGKIKDNSFDVFLGATTDAGVYGHTAGVVYFGITGYKDIKISESFSLPVFCRFITNPQNENVHLVFGMSL